MFFKKKEEKLELLYLDNIKVNCPSMDKTDVIKTVGQMLVDTGYVDQSYVDGMLEREKTFPTYMGNGLALPHGVEAAKKAVKQSGIAIMVFPEGIDWSGETANFVVGVAGVGDAHLEILSKIAEKILDEESFKTILNSSPEEVYKILDLK